MRHRIYGLNHLARRISPFHVVAFAFGLRGLFFLLARGNPLWEHLFSDQKVYDKLARGIIESGSPVLPSAFYISPLYTYLVTIFYAAFGRVPDVVRIFQLALGSVSCGLIFAAARRMFGAGPAVLASLLCCFYGIFAYYEGFIIVDSIQVFLVALFLYCFVRLYFDGKLAYVLLAGTALGLSFVSRANTAIFILPALYFVLRSFKGRLLKALGCLLLPLAVPALLTSLHNYVSEKVFVPVTSNLGFNFYIGNHQGADGKFMNLAGFDFYEDPVARKYAAKLAGRKLSSPEASAFWLRKALEFVRDDPIGFCGLQLKKLALFFNAAELDHLGLDYGFFREKAAPILFLFPVNFAVVFPLAVAGLGLLAAKRRFDPLILYLLSFFVLYTLSITVFFIADRLRLPGVVFLFVFAGYFLGEVAAGELAIRKFLLPAGCGLLALLLATVLNFREDNDLSVSYLRLGTAHFKSGNAEACVSMLEKALEIKDDGDVRLNLGICRAAAGEIGKAIESFKKAGEMKPEDPDVYNNLGNAYMIARRPAEAVAAYKTAIGLDGGMAAAYRNLGFASLTLGKPEEARVTFQKYLGIETDPAERKHVVETLEKLETAGSQSGEQTWK